jgi:hypothetical protein
VWPALLTAAVLILTTAGASAAIETDTVASYWRGLWWSTSLITTFGFIGQPPGTVAGAVLSAFLLVFSFLLLAMVSAALAAIFVRDDEQPRDSREESAKPGDAARTGQAGTTARQHRAASARRRSLTATRR